MLRRTPRSLGLEEGGWCGVLTEGTSSVRHCKLVEWYILVLKSERHASSQEERGEEVDAARCLTSYME